jgi:hypothetical protein
VSVPVRSPVRVSTPSPATPRRNSGGPWLGVLLLAGVGAAVVIPLSRTHSEPNVQTPAAVPVKPVPSQAEEHPLVRFEEPAASRAEKPEAPPTPPPTSVEPPAPTPETRPSTPPEPPHRTPTKKPPAKGAKHREPSGPPLNIPSEPQWGDPSSTAPKTEPAAVPNAAPWGKPAGTPLPAEDAKKLFTEADAEKETHPQDAEAKLQRVIEMTKPGTDLHDRAYALLTRLRHSHR